MERIRFTSSKSTARKQRKKKRKQTLREWERERQQRLDDNRLQLAGALLDEINWNDPPSIVILYAKLLLKEMFAAYPVLGKEFGTNLLGLADEDELEPLP